MEARFAALLLLLAACSGAAGELPEMRGRRVRLRILDAEKLELAGKRMSWEDAFARLADRVQAANGDVDALPWIQVLATKDTPMGLIDELLTSVQELGIRSVTIGS